MSAVASTRALSGKYPGTVGDVTLLNLLSLSSWATSVSAPVVGEIFDILPAVASHLP